MILLNSKRPGVYLESCDYAPDLNLKCIKGICQCLENQYFKTKCLDKKTNLQVCQDSNQCKDNTNLVCYANVKLFRCWFVTAKLELVFAESLGT